MPDLERPLRGTRTYVLITCLVIASGMLISFLVASSNQRLHDISVENFTDDQSKAIQTALSQRIRAYEDILLSASGIFAVHESLTRSEWQRYATELMISQRYPGTIGIGYLPYVRRSEKNDFLQQIRSDGLPNFTIKPDGERDVYTPIVYFEPAPSNDNPVVGFDIMSESSRNEALFDARDSGNAAATLTLPLLLAEPSRTVRGVGIIKPIYDTSAPTSNPSERQAAIKGYLFAVLGINDVMANLFDLQNNDDRFGFQVEEHTPSGYHELYTSKNFDKIDTSIGRYKESVTFAVLNQMWQVHITTNTNYFSRHALSPALLFGTGAVVSIVIGIGAFLLMINRISMLSSLHQREVQRTKDELLALASHQLRTPASGVKQYLGLVIQGYAGELDEEQQLLLDKAYAANERQLEIINQLLYVAKADAGQLRVEKEPCNLTDLIDDVVAGYADFAKERSITLVFAPRPAVQVNGDERYLRMIIENLINNALKYTHRGGKITVLLALEQDGWASLTIKDTGVGIDPTDHERVFEKFTRITNELSRESGGSGIGLYLSRELAMSHGGTIKVASAKGKGAMFTLRLPQASKAREKSKKPHRTP